MIHRFLFLTLVCVTFQINALAQVESRFLEAIELSKEYPDQSLSIYQDIIKESDANASDSIKFMAYLGISDLYRFKSMTDSALQFAIIANSVAEANSRNDLLAMALLKISRLYKDLELLEQSNEYILRAKLAITQDQYPKIWCNILKAKALMAMETGDMNRCHELMDSAIVIANSINDTSLSESFMVDKAIRYYNESEYDKAISIYESLLSRETTSHLRMICLHSLIFIYVDQGNLSMADDLSKVFLNLAREGVSIDHKIQATYDRIGVLEQIGDYKEALELYYEMDEMEDSLYTNELANALSDMHARFDIAQKESELQKAKSEIELNTIQQRSLFGAIAALGILMIIGYFLFKQRLQNRALAAEKEKKEKELFEIRNTELKNAFDEIEYKNQEITASIKYAKRIQKAILPSNKILKHALPESFVFYKPKDIVAGDFYWVEMVEDWVFFAAADCTGHGVPGAMVSVICNNGLNRSVREFGLREPGQILNKTRELVIKEFEKSDEEVKDGMDVSLYALNRKTNFIKWSGANNPFCVGKSNGVSEDRLVEIRADKQPIGAFGAGKPFTQHEMQLEKGDMIYSYSDGYPDQFGGEQGKKFKSVNFKKLLADIAEKSMKEQHDMLMASFEKWRGDLEQIDDVCVFGVRV